MKLTIMIDRITTDLGGTEGQVVKLIRGLAECGHQVELITFEGSDWVEKARRALPCRIEVVELGGVARPGFLLGLMRLWRHLRRNRPDVVHTFFPIANIVGVLCARAAGVRAVLASRRDYGYWITPGYLKATRFANRFVDSIVVNAPQVAAFTHQTEGVPESKIKVIFNGVDVDGLCRPAPNLSLKSRLGIPQDHLVISLVANIRYIKRHDTLVRAVARLISKYPKLSLLFVGADNDTPEKLNALFRLIDELGMKERVFRALASGDIAEYLSIMDIGCNCSESEGLSNAVIEYMAAGVASVVSNGGGNPDLVNHGVDGFVFTVGDDEMLAGQLERLIAEPDLRARLAQAGQDKVRNEMSLPRIIKCFEQHYLDTLPALARGAAHPARDVSGK
jgi:L-malate glycosyltransferase